MGREYTDGQELYLREEYEEALGALRVELLVGQGDKEINSVFVASLNGTFRTNGQAGLLALILQHTRKEQIKPLDIKILNLLEDSSNAGVRRISSFLQSLLSSTESVDQMESIDSFIEATTNTNAPSTLFVPAAKLFQARAEQGYALELNAKNAIALYQQTRKADVEFGTPRYGHTLLDQAQVHRTLALKGVDSESQFVKAIRLTQRAREEGLEQGSSNYAHALMDQAVNHRGLGGLGVDPISNYKNAVQLAKQAREGVEPGTREYADTLFVQATAQRDLGARGVEQEANFKTAMNLLQRAREEGLGSGSSDYGRTFLDQAAIHWYRGRRGVEPKDNFERGIQLAKRSRQEGLEPGMADFGRSLFEQSKLHRELGRLGINPEANFKKAIQLTKRAREEGFASGNQDYFRTFVDQAVHHLLRGQRGLDPEANYNEAIKLAQQAKSGLKYGTRYHARSLIIEAQARHGLGKLGVDSKANFEEAIRLLQRIQDKGGIEPGTPNYARLLATQAKIHKSLAKRGIEPADNHEQAIRLVLQAKDVEGLDPDTPVYGRVLRTQSRLHHGLGALGIDAEFNFKIAIQLAQQARKNGLEQGTPDFALALLDQVDAHRHLGKRGIDPDTHFDMAEEACTRAKEILDDSGELQFKLRAEKLTGQLFRIRGDDQTAFDSYTTAVEVVEEMRSSIRIKEHRETFFEDYISVYFQTIDLALDLEREEEAFEYVERAKGRIFLELLEDTRIKGEIPDELDVKETELRKKIANLRETLRTADFGDGNRFARSALGSFLSTSHSSAESSTYSSQSDVQEWRQKVRDELDAAIEKREDVLKEIQAADPETHALKTVSVASIDDIQAILAPDEQIVEYIWFGNELVIFLLDHESLDWHRVPLEGSDAPGRGGLSLLEAIREFRLRIEPPGRSSVQGVCQDLYQVLIAPVETDLDEELIIVPHGPLHLVPFATLYDGDQYLIESHTLKYAANATSLTFLEEKLTGDPHQEVLVVGDPRGDLPHGRNEAREVATIHGTDVVEGEDATTAKVQAELEAADLAHFSCHGYYDADSPWHSYLLLADGEMQLDDVINLRLGADLVTLSACETAYGDVSTGDEVDSLTRGFQYAGSPLVIGSLWAVDDISTKQFFNKFYTSDGTAAERLQATQQSFINRKGDYAHPYYWSAFELYGREPQARTAE